MNRAEILTEAIGIITKDRSSAYGSPEDSFRRIAALWSTWLQAPITPLDVAAMMILMKVARLNVNPLHMDSWVDIAGYAGCGGEIAGQDVQLQRPMTPPDYPRNPLMDKPIWKDDAMKAQVDKSWRGV
jgi:hypothetical protein